jgi:hypothetical protein
MHKIDLSQFPEKGTFDFPAIGSNLTREKVKEITDTWTQPEIEIFAAKYPNKVVAVKNSGAPEKDK